MEERLLITLALGLAGTLAYLALRWMHHRKLTKGNPALLHDWRAGLPGILYFASEGCSSCRTQARVVQRLAGGLEERINLARIDVERQWELAREWKVVTVPTTVVVSGDGEAKAVNHGAASKAKLRRQLEGVLQT
jgi:thioredoxin 1